MLPVRLRISLALPSTLVTAEVHARDHRAATDSMPTFSGQGTGYVRSSDQVDPDTRLHRGNVSSIQTTILNLKKSSKRRPPGAWALEGGSKLELRCGRDLRRHSCPLDLTMENG